MKRLLVIFILIPCFLKAQTTDTVYSDTTTTIKVVKSGNVNFDTLKVSTNSLQCFHYVCGGFSKTTKASGIIDVWVRNVDGVYDFWLDSGTPIISSNGNSLTANKVGNLIIIQYKTQSIGNILNWTLVKTKISL